MSTNNQEVIEKLSPLEKKIIPFLNLSIHEIEEKSGLDHSSVTLALKVAPPIGPLLLPPDTKARSMPASAAENARRESCSFEEVLTSVTDLETIDNTIVITTAIERRIIRRT